MNDQNELNKQVECCPRFDPELWDGKSFEWDNKKFIKDNVFTLFYMPINYGSVITRMIAAADKAGARVPEWLFLAEHTSGWNMDLYLAVDKEVPGAENVAMTGKFLSKVYEGSFKNTGKWCKDFEKYAKDKGVKVEKMYMWYTTCPKCAKKYGKNYVAIIAKA
jgi:hypothetical protein